MKKLIAATSVLVTSVGVDVCAPASPASSKSAEITDVTVTAEPLLDLERFEAAWKLGANQSADWLALCPFVG